jgi:hypothetical protein
MAGRQREGGTGGKGRSGGRGQGSNQRGMREVRGPHRMGAKEERKPVEQPPVGPTKENVKRAGPKGRQPLPATQARARRT